MSESGFLKAQAAAFMRKHPRDEGWFMHQVEGMALWSTQLLPAFLRDRAPGAVLREDIRTCLDWNSEKGRDRMSLMSLHGRRRGQGITELDWYGEIDFLWRGSPIHYCCQPVIDRFNATSVAFVAVKDRGLLEQFWRELTVYERRQMRMRSSLYDMADGPMPRPRARWEELVLPGTMREEIRSGFESFLIARSKFKELNLPYRRGFLFSGPPGCGKTLAVRIIASQPKCAVINLVLKAQVKDEVVARAFRMASREAPAVLILEDLDRIAVSKDISMSFLLNLLDGLITSEGVLVVATTNHPEKLDTALLQRPSRFDKVWNFPLPGFAERLELMRRKAAGKFSEQALDAAARQSQGFSMAYVQETVVDALLRALYKGRPACDQDLADSTARLREQFSTGFKPDAALQTPKSVGFGAA